MKRTFTTALCVTAALFVMLFMAACGKGKAAGFTVDDFALYKYGANAQVVGTLPAGGGIEIASVASPLFQTRRGVAPGDGVEKLLEQYGMEMGDFSYVDASGNQLETGAMTLSQFYEAGAVPDFTASFLLLELEGKAYGYGDLDALPEEELIAGEYTVYNLAFTVQAGDVDSIVLSSAVAPAG